MIGHQVMYLFIVIMINFKVSMQSFHSNAERYLGFWREKNNLQKSLFFGSLIGRMNAKPRLTILNSLYFYRIMDFIKNMLLRLDF